MALPLSGALGIFVDGPYIYFDEKVDYMIHRVRRDRTGGVEDIAPRGVYVIHDRAIAVRHYDEATGISTISEIDQDTLAVRKLPLPPGYFHRYEMDADAYYAFGIGCSARTRLSRETGEAITLPMDAITEGGSQPLGITDDYVYCANSWTVIRVNKDFESPPEVVFENKAFVRAFAWDSPRPLWIQDGEFGPV